MRSVRSATSRSRPRFWARIASRVATRSRFRSSTSFCCWRASSSRLRLSNRRVWAVTRLSLAREWENSMMAK
jgi:hypothetical protein